MPIDTSPRMILKSGLDKIVEGIDLKKGIEYCEEALRESSENPDRDLRYMKSRADSDFLKVQLELDDLTNVGGYKLRRKTTSRGKTIGFYKDNFGVEFYFERQEIDAGEQLVELASSGKEFNSDELNELGETIVNDAVFRGESKRNAGEILIGKDSRSLKSYKLKNVFRIEKIPRVWLGFFPLPAKVRREIVYVSE
jgi:hypothetical protein